MNKGPDAFRTISEAAEEIGVPQHVLRFWETKFSFIRPMKRAGGRRFYRRQDIEVLRGVRRLLHEEGYTIKGVQRLHKEQGVKRLLVYGESAPIALFEADPAEMTRDAAEAQAVQYAAEQRPGTEAEPEVEVVAAERPVLTSGARQRLQRVLDDLESTQARIDALVGGAGGSRA